MKSALFIAALFVSSIFQTGCAQPDSKYKDRVVIIGRELCDTVETLRYRDYTEDTTKAYGHDNTYFSDDTIAEFICYILVPKYGMQIYSPTTRWRGVDCLLSDIGKEYYITNVRNIKFFYNVPDISYSPGSGTTNYVGALRVTAEILICKYLISRADLPDTGEEFNKYLQAISDTIQKRADLLISNGQMAGVSGEVSTYAAELIREFRKEKLSEYEYIILDDFKSICE